MRSQILVQGEDIEQEGVDVDALHAPGARLPRIDREIVDHVLHRADLAHDRLRSSQKRVFVGTTEFPGKFDRKSLGGKLDRGERVLDLVCETARDFRPSRVALCFSELGHVVENNHASGSRFSRKARSA